jgi:Putative beta-barrel porin-2, OmpL-like. bbp2
VNEISLGASSPDVNNEKSYIGRVGIGNDMVSLATTVAYGAEGPGSSFGIRTNEQKTGIVDVLANFNSDVFSAYVNADYLWVEGQAPSAWGVSVAGKVPITDLLFAALRLEYVRDVAAGGSSILGATDFLGIGTPFNHSEVYGATGTLGYEIAENLTLKGEVRWDHVAEETYGGNCSLGGGCASPREFFSRTSGGSNSQVVGLGQVVYAF